MLPSSGLGTGKIEGNTSCDSVLDATEKMDLPSRLRSRSNIDFQGIGYSPAEDAAVRSRIDQGSYGDLVTTGREREINGWPLRRWTSRARLFFAVRENVEAR